MAICNGVFIFESKTLQALWRNLESRTCQSKSLGHELNGKHASSLPRKAKSGTKLSKKMELLVLSGKILGILIKLRGCIVQNVLKMCKASTEW